ncbi:MAG: glycosyltransferase [Candidatus Hinthialibacter antarcticus]|nr:glycosyltransferase [Candidatus Hinthialibacter antarcticus]
MTIYLEFIVAMGLGALIYIYAGYPVLLYLLSLLHSMRHKPDDAYTPKVTLLFSAYNELASLPDKLANLRALDYPAEKLQILIASDASSDGTDDYLANQPGIDFVPMQERGGKNAALNAMLPKAQGDVLFFTDANTLHKPESIRAVIKHLADPHVGAVTGRLVFTQERDWNAVGRGTGLYWWYENKIKQAENRLGSVLVGSGSVLAARRDLVGPLDPRIANDLEIPSRIGAKGYAILFEPDCCGSEKPHTDMFEEWRRTSRIVSRGLRGFVVLLPTLLRSPLRFWQFLSHKFLRWFTLPLSVATLVASGFLYEQSVVFQTIFISGLFILGAALYGLLLIVLNIEFSVLRPFKLLGHFLWMHTAAVWGLVLAVFGQTPAAWRLPESSRK